VKLLLDSCVASHARAELAAAGHDVEATSEWPRDPGDDEILAYAFKNERVLVTLDKDFGELAVVGECCAAAVAKYGAELGNGAIVTVETSRVRVRPPGAA
jgi:predicted nuclease of predicted toxin-antitoxin system